MATTSTIKNIASVSLCLGLIASIEDKYKNKRINESIKRVKKEGFKLLDCWPENLTIKEVEKIKRRILCLEKWLDKKKVPVFTSTALGVLNDSKQYWKSDTRKQAETFETRLLTLHKMVDYNFSKINFDDYDSAKKAVDVWMSL